MDNFGPTNRLILHSVLVSIMGQNKVYFQPPSSIKLTYPCIIYRLSTIKTEYANSVKYKNKLAYTITLIDQNPDTEIPNELLALDYCSFDEYYVSDNLHHYHFTLYY